jgi:hypothetical protein
MQTVEAPPRRSVTFVVPVESRGEILETNFLTSPCLRGPHNHQILVQEKFSCAAKAYNDAIDRSMNDLIVFCHHDVFLPLAWLSDLEQALDCLEVYDPNWGVLGCSGITREGRHWRYIYSSGLGICGEPFVRPEAVQTLDEIVLIVRKSSTLYFDELLPHFHFYGADICLRAAKMGMKSYAISAFCIHNAHQNLILPQEFYDCSKHIKRVWKEYLPIQTTCIRITRSSVPIFIRKLREAYLRHIRRKEVGGVRAQSVERLFDEIGPIHKQT